MMLFHTPIKYVAGVIFSQKDNQVFFAPLAKKNAMSQRSNCWGWAIAARLNQKHADTFVWIMGY